MWAVRSERCAIVWFILDRCDVMESGRFQAKSLAATARAKFDCCETHIRLNSASYWHYYKPHHH